LLPLNLFYEEPEPDRWLPFDRYPRRILRRLIRGKPRPGGQGRMFLNLCAGLDRITAPYRINDYRHAVANPDEIACIVGQPFVLDKISWRNPIVFGAAIYAHPIEDPHLLRRLPVQKILVPGPWMKSMYEPMWNGAVESWPVGIDTELWNCPSGVDKLTDVLLYDKVRWERDELECTLIEPIRTLLRKHCRSVHEIRYGHYSVSDYRDLLSRCRAMVFLCEHETQGLAYQEALSSGVPIFAWDRGGAWRDPSFFPHKVQFGPVTSVPYWDDRCGMRFADVEEFESDWPDFWDKIKSGAFRPRDFVVDNLSLEHCARQYVEVVQRVAAAIGSRVH
jgi:hypothetical protein